MVKNLFCQKHSSVLDITIDETIHLMEFAEISVINKFFTLVRYSNMFKICNLAIQIINTI